jgi:hypothetical protein
MKKFVLFIYQGATPPIPGTDRWKALAVLGFVVSNDRIVKIYVLSDPNRVQQLIEPA